MKFNGSSTRTPVVSVVIPCYNQAHYLGEAIESARRQTHPDVEIIVVDDGSKDNTLEVARSYQGVRAVAQANQGQGAARNRGLEHATGAYVVFLDSDDRLLPQAFEIALELFDAHPDCAFVTGRCLWIGADGNRGNVVPKPLILENHYVHLLQHNFIWAPASVMFRTAVVRGAGGFATTVSGAEDYDLYLRIAREHRILCHESPVAEYRQHDTATSRNSRLMLSSTVKVIRRQRRWVKGDPRAERAWRQGLRHWQEAYGGPLVNTMRRQVRAREWQRAMAAMLTLCQYYPSGLLHHASRKLYRLSSGYRPERPDAIR